MFKKLNIWFIGTGILGALALGSGAMYALTRLTAPVALMLLFMAGAIGCYYKGSHMIAQVPTISAEAPLTSKVNCLCIYAKEEDGVRKTVKIDFEYREEKEAIQKLIDNLDPNTSAENREAIKKRLDKAISSAVLNSDRWFFEDISKWLPVIYTDLDDAGQWRAFELPDAKYTDPARMAIPLNMSAVQKWRELELSTFEKLKPLIMVGMNAIAMFFIFLILSNNGGQ